MGRRTLVALVTALLALAASSAQAADPFDDWWSDAKISPDDYRVVNYTEVFENEGIREGDEEPPLENCRWLCADSQVTNWEVDEKKADVQISTDGSSYDAVGGGEGGAGMDTPTSERIYVHYFPGVLPTEQATDAPTRGTYETPGCIWVWCERPHSNCEPPGWKKKLWICDVNLETTAAGGPGNLGSSSSYHNGDGSHQDRDDYDHAATPQPDNKVLWLALNDDDDDSDLEEDRTQTGTVCGEDDLVELQFQFSKGIVEANAGTVEITMSPILKLYRDEYRTNEVTTLTYNLPDSDFTDYICNKTLYIEGYMSSACPNDGYVTLTYTLDGKTTDDIVHYTVVDVDQTFYKRDGTTEVVELDEDEPGAYVAFNNDDDDTDGGGTTADKDDTNGVTGEDDLVKVYFDFADCFNSLETGKVVLKRENTKIRLWKESTKTNEIVFDQAGNTEKIYNLATPADRTAFASDINDQTCWVEGSVASGSLKDTGLNLICRDEDDDDVCEDPVEVTVIRADLTVYGGDKTTAVRMDKEDDPGAYVFYNRDDDNGNDAADTVDTTVAGENDLRKAKCEFNTFFSSLDKGKVILQRENTKLKVWRQETKGAQEITFTANKRTYDLNTSAGRTAFAAEVLTKDLWVEGHQKSGALMDTNLRVIYQDEDDDDVDVDRVKFTSVELEATYLAFNKDRTAHTSDGVNIRQDKDPSEITAPEWQGPGAGNTEPAKSEPALHIMSTTVKVWVRLESDPAITSAKIRAVGSQVPPGALSLGNLGATAGGAESWKTVTFTAGVSDGVAIGGTAGFVEFAPQNDTTNKVFFEDAMWQFKVKDINTDTTVTWFDANAPGQRPKTDGAVKKWLRLYTILDTPRAPWDTADTGVDDVKQPWVDALEFSTNWAKNAATLAAAATPITEGIFDGKPFKYDKALGAWGFKVGAKWNLTLFISRLKTHNAAQEGCCYDAAQATCVFTNLCGAAAGNHFKRLHSHPFGYLNVFDPIGAGDDLGNSPFLAGGQRKDPFCYQDGDEASCDRTDFANHEVAGPSDGAAATVWDATMKIISGAGINPDTCAVYPPNAKVPATSSAVTETVLTDAAAAWTVNQYQPAGGTKYYLFPNMNAKVPNPYKRYEIASNTATTITVKAGSTMLTDDGGLGAGDNYAIFDFNQGPVQPTGVATEYLTAVGWAAYKTKCVDDTPGTGTGNPTETAPLDIQ